MAFDPYRSQQLTNAGTINRGLIAATVPGMAHFAGTGPMDKTCGDCIHWKSMPRKTTMHCAKFVALTGNKALKPIPHGTWACRHFETRK